MAPMGRVPKVTRVCGVDMGKMLNYNKVKTAVDMHCFHTHTHKSQVTQHTQTNRIILVGYGLKPYAHIALYGFRGHAQSKHAQHVRRETYARAKTV